MTKIIKIIVIILINLQISISFAQNQYELLYLKNNYSEIIKLTSEKISAGNSVANDFYWNGFVFKKQGQLNKSIEILEQGKYTYPDNKNIELLLADVYYEIGNYQKAKPILLENKYLSDNGVKLVTICEFNQNFNEAIDYLLDFYEKDSTNIMYLKLLGSNYSKIDSLDKATDFYEKSLELYPDDQVTAYKLAVTYFKMTYYYNSIIVCKKNIEKNSSDIKFQRLCGYSYFRKNEFDSSSHYFINAYKLGDTSKFLLKHLGISELSKKLYKTGRIYLSRAYKLDSNDIEICYYLGTSYINAPNPEQGFYYLDRADSLIQADNKLLSSIYAKKSEIFLSLKNYSSAINLYNNAYEIEKNPIYLYYIASIHHNYLDNKQVAINYYELFVKEVEQLSENSFKVLTERAKKYIVELKEDLFFEGKLK